MNRPTKHTAGGQAYLDMRNRARREGRTTQELLILYVLERWLARLAASPSADIFVLKGGMLLAALGARRPTADADLLARRLANDARTVGTRVQEIAQTTLSVDDGVDYLVETIGVRSIREEDLYAGVRISMDCRISTAEVKLKLDINFGDPVTPEPRIVQLPSQRDSYPAVPVLGYPIETVLAEKVCTAIALGEANTRVRDYADLYTLTGNYPLSYGLMRAALHATAAYRRVTLVELSSVIGSLPAMRQSAYQAFRKRLGVADTHLPASFIEVVVAVVAFVDPLLNGQPENLMWLPTARHWR
jgi:hypothetical protein